MSSSPRSTKGVYASTTRAAVSQLCQLLTHVSENCDRNPQDKSAPNMEILIESTNLLQTHSDVEQLLFVAKASHVQFLLLLPVVLQAKQKNMSDHLRTQLLKGGGSFPKYISRSDKEYMSIDFSMAAGAHHGNSPEPFLEEQCKVFGQFWNPSMSANQIFQLHQNLKDYREYAKEEVVVSEHTPSNYKRAIHSYHKDTTGDRTCGQIRFSGKCQILSSPL